jgi:ADP-heptose:LPS heptosyltransferase
VRPLVYTNAEDEAAAAALWAGLGLARKARVLACFMTTRQPTGVWPVENFGRALALLRQEFHIVLCGANGDKALLEGVNRDFELRADIVAGELGLRPLESFLRRVQVVLCTDSGPRHIANAAGVPVFFFRNLRSDPVETGAYLETETDFCPPTGWLHTGQHGAVLAKITPEQVAKAVTERVLRLKASS